MVHVSHPINSKSFVKGTEFTRRLIRVAIPQANGLVEGANQTILAPMLAAALDEQNPEWDRELKRRTQDVNLTQNKTTGRAPYEVLYGYIPRFNEGQVRELTSHCETYSLPTEIQNDIREITEKEQARYKDFYDRKWNTNVKFALGDIVFISVNPVATGESTKLQYRYRGPYVVSDVLLGDTYEIERLSNKRRSTPRLTADVSQMKI